MRHDRASWFEAQYDCESVGADLASVHTKAENEFIRVYAQRAIGVTSVWLGMSLNIGGKFFTFFYWCLSFKVHSYSQRWALVGQCRMTSLGIGWSMSHDIIARVETCQLMCNIAIM